MSEKRKPDAVIMISAEDGSKTRYEIFKAQQFAERMMTVPFFHAEQPTLQVHQVDLDNQEMVRVRVNGKWEPSGRRAFFPLWRASFLIAQHIQSSLAKKVIE